ncbi:alanyl-tRNA synthetase [Halococcus thailandensis JCM 13552]|uniref:Alanyl-tRNA synthetase n=2 Tax=Halococcus thailandensis TaxID=335952 RepID=M0NHQ6_9EURY|nr:alanyl-tRNA synthetase [Halococcus thailandensis JCM 13552]
MLVGGIAFVATCCYWWQRERRIRESLIASREWAANTAGEIDREGLRAAEAAAERLDARVEDLPQRIATLDEERRDLRREVSTARERWADALWHARFSRENDGGRSFDDGTVRTIEFERGELADARALAKRASDEAGVTLIAAHGDGSFAVAVGETTTDEFSATDIADDLADEVGGGAGGNERLAAGGGATGALSEGCQRIQDHLLQSDTFSSREAPASES